ncbi:LysM peptidoglycan-binding domain-containing protein [Spirosoma rhododendri]|uniref:LysM peptidoglycan-binding domain-containing protein n=1 Tax=Spirosoma rhododendri TaxID=2728024 RepID=A0A7L5DZV5_9BACT|nr:lytic transglycosylase domain-containing protein [Spirosoma rhododendri]QJD81030.1 LysM peptidoglycan-binding domain-containing protein [Spirosoma rhododendri]
MLKRTPFLFFILWLTAAFTMAQTPAPNVPDRLTFADISVRLDDNARRIVQQDVNSLLANRQYWTAKLDRVALYFPIIEAILIQEDVPTDFKYLAVQESSLTPDAVSSSAAVGYWQFKRETATGLGMRVDEGVDERKSITASTHGAAQYMKRSNAQFNNWIASLYSYYLGAGGIAKLIPPDWAYAREIALDGRTDRYILRFFAHKLAIENALKSHQTSNRIALLEYPGSANKTFKEVADELSVDEFELRKYNRWLTDEAVPADKDYVMVVPVPTDQINDVRQKIVSVTPRKAADAGQIDVGFPVLRRVTTGLKDDPFLYEINGLPGIQAQAGDNAATLARKSKISMSSFLRYNDLDESDPIIVGDVYYLAKKRKKALVPFHTVRAGETARSISQRYGLRLKRLLRYNRVDRTLKLATGRVMWLRERRPASKPVEIINAPTPAVYDQTPTPPARTDIADGSLQPTRTVAGGNSVPRTMAERKKYQPKLVGGGVTPNDGTSQPAAPQPAIEVQSLGGDGWSTGSTGSGMSKKKTPRTTPAGTTVSQPAGADGSQRLVIVRTPTGDAGQPETRAVPVATTPERTQPVSAAPAAVEKPASKPTASVEMSAPVRATKPKSVSDDDLQPAEPRTVSRPATPKPESRPAEPVVVKSTPEPKPAPAEPAPISRPATPVDRSATTHIVEPKETYYSIARMHGLTVDELLTINGLTANDPLPAGKKLSLKATGAGTTTPKAQTPKPTVGSAAPASGAAASSAKTVYHTVGKGETMYRISRDYGVTVQQIQEWNSLTDTNVKEGQKLKIEKSE